MKRVLDLRKPNKVELDYSGSDINWMLAWALVILFVAAAIAFNIWLNHGCELSGIITWHGKMCLN